MTWENPPATIERLREHLTDCDTWPGEADNVHYPKADNLADEEYPAAVLVDTGRSGAVYAAGAEALPSGSLLIIIRAAMETGELEQFARDILDEILAQQTGIPFTGGEVGLCSEPSPAKTAGGVVTRSITIALQWGLTP